ncbi:hypothetical protein TNCV_1968301 [Trichonephila clavipes]|nr:hypothetical protein TNCV_1968301 [Trichonephila clavipes]
MEETGRLETGQSQVKVASGYKCPKSGLLVVELGNQFETSGTMTRKFCSRFLYASPHYTPPPPPWAHIN